MHREFIWLPDEIATSDGESRIDGNTYVVSIEFTDTAGKRWKRDPRGALRSPDADESSPS